MSSLHHKADIDVHAASFDFGAIATVPGGAIDFIFACTPSAFWRSPLLPDDTKLSSC
jgi:hypothetical protein